MCLEVDRYCQIPFGEGLEHFVLSVLTDRLMAGKNAAGSGCPGECWKEWIK